MLRISAQHGHTPSNANTDKPQSHLGSSDTPRAVVHFVEDRLDTLIAVAETADLAHVRLYFADWGYSTPAERKEASGIPNVQIIDLTQFHTLLRTGQVPGRVCADVPA